MSKRSRANSNNNNNKKSNKKLKIRAHVNPLDKLHIAYPNKPQDCDWSQHYPTFFSDDIKEREYKVAFADVGCGFGGLLENLSLLFPDKLMVGLEIRPKVVPHVQSRTQRLREKPQSTTIPQEIADLVKAKEQKQQEQKQVVVQKPFSNISVLETNIMRYCANYFVKGQLEKMFFCFPDPHFKRANFRRRVVNRSFIDIYAYVLQEDGIAYTITDVKDLHDWMVEQFQAHPLFKQIDHDLNDPVIIAMCNTDEGRKVTRNNGSKYIALFQRLSNPA